MPRWSPRGLRPPPHTLRHIHALTHTHTQVLHIRNLPPDATEEQITALCKPYGRIVRVRLNAGAIKTQAFVEFESVNSAMQMIYSFVGNPDPPKVCGGGGSRPAPRHLKRLGSSSRSVCSRAQPTHTTPARQPAQHTAQPQ
jgi:hypothetical protein